jgi:hypothetical protein
MKNIDLSNNPEFDGAGYVTSRDLKRLTGQIKRVHEVMSDGEWHTLNLIAFRAGAPAASASAQLRHLRKPRFGGFVIEREYVCNGIFKYRMLEKEL